ncbi:MAG: putative porin [Verrucomicrobiota bacterium]
MKYRTHSLTRSTALLFAAALPLRGAEPANPQGVQASQPPRPLGFQPGEQSPGSEPSALILPDGRAGSPVAAQAGSLHHPPDDAGLLPPPGAVPPTASTPAAAPARGPSRNFSINLLKRLVERGALTQKDAEELIQLADADVSAAGTPAPPAPQTVAVPVPTPAPAPLPGEVRVTYVPETVRNRIRDEVRDQLRSEAKAEGWLGEKPNTGWFSRVEPFADIRVRYEIDTFPDGNDNTGAFPNFNAINTGSPFDVAGNEFSPQNNVDQERQRARLRFRLGAEMDLNDNFRLGFRVGTGQDNSPVSSNQTLGYAGDGQGGNFSKYALWLDRAFVAWEPNDVFKLSIGRFDNPFFSTTNIWSEDIGFDGLALHLHHRANERFQPFLTAGLFPVFNTALNYSTNQPAKFESVDKWLYAVQIGADMKLSKDLKAKLGVGFHDFDNIEGELSDPFTPLTSKDAGNTDGTRPAFAQKGNTYRPLRNIVPGPLNNYGTTNQYQYFGLASPFQVLAATGRLDYDGWEPLRISLVGEYSKNLAFDQSDINAVAVNNRGPNGSDGSLGVFDGDDTAWYLNLMAGHAALDRRGAWNAFAGYRYIGSDAVVDGFNDQNFGGGGTNMKGFTLGLNYALSPRVSLGTRWFSADEIAGPAFKSDIIMFDFNAKF